jgi:DNA-binding transcriptional regulator YhcF (GntR family)
MVQLRRDGGAPLYRQIATRLQYEIAMGELAPGDRLPPIRNAEASWCVSRHTVRRAYGLLESEGLVETLHGSGTRVTAGKPRFAPDAVVQDVQKFTTWVASVARERFGLSPDELAYEIRAGDAGHRVVWVAECSDLLATALADQIRDRWDVNVRPWRLGSQREIPAGDVVSTFYHVGDVRSATTPRAPAPVFLPVELDPSYLRRLKRLTAASGVETTLCGTDTETLDGMANDLLRRMPGLHLTRTVRSAAAVLAARSPNSVTILSPETWDATSPEDREQPDVLAHLSRFLPDHLAEHAWSAGWKPRADGANRNRG